ncbi:MAG: hypothetical protein J5I93_07485, partial [Pirellulaceae bacterium]|nr:hypothetical protein [Pirellulaceae bacterium]
MSQATETTIRRGPWRPRESTERAWRRRYLRRGVFTAATLLLVALLLYLLLRPFWHPDTKLVILTAPEYAVGTAAPLSFSRQEAGGLEALRPALYHDRGAEAPLVLPSLTNPGRVDSLADQLQVIRTGGSDVLLLYIAAHGLVLDGEPYLMCQDFDASQPLAGMVRLSDLLRQVDKSPASVKLLILDSGQLAYEPRLGMLVNEFPRLLPAALASVRDPAAGSRGRSSSLWVLNSNSAGERSHVSRSLQRTVFGFFVSEGLKGAADLNGDKLVDVGELHRFVATHVSSWVNRYSAGNETQTPMLLSSDDTSRLARGGYPQLLSIAAFPRDERNLDLGRSLYLARESSRTLSYFTGSSMPVNEYSLMMRATSPLYHSRAGGTLLRGYYASRYARTAAQAAPLPAAGAEAGAAGEAAAPAAGG